MKRFSILILVIVCLLLQTLPAFDFIAAQHPLLLVVRWITVILLFIYAYRSKSLTSWILVAMVAGVALGFDFPAIAVHMKVFSQIFLRLIKTIIAPLIFATLVVGIAGHSNMKQLGPQLTRNQQEPSGNQTDQWVGNRCCILRSLPSLLCS